MTSTVRFVEGLGFDIGADKKVKLVWDNGKAFDTVKGASVGYIPPHMYAHFAKDKEGKPGHYNLASDYKSMRDGKVSMQVAMTTCVIRAAGFSVAGLVLNRAEIVLEDAAKDETEADAQLADWLVKNAQPLKNVIQQSLSIMALNGISMVVNGHHYVAEQSMWSRFISASDWDNIVANLGLVNWEGAVYHDAFHMVDVDWLATEVTSSKSRFIGHVNGVVSKRIPAQPSGTLMIAVLLAMLNDLSAASPKLHEVFSAVKEPAERIQAIIRSAPLDWCAQFPRVTTNANLARVDKFAPISVVLYSYLNTVLEKKPTSLRSKALKAAAGKNTPQVIIGQQLAAKFPVAELDVETFADMIIAMISDVEVENK
jgi:hypothetical protein